MTPKSPSTIVLGRELEEARERDRALHREEGSPLSDVEYRDGEHDLLRLRPAAADAAVEGLLHALLGGTAEAGAVRVRLTLHDFYTLLTFVRRAIVRSLRGDPSASMLDAAALLAFIDPARIDPRDLDWAAALCAWRIQALGIDDAEVLEAARRWAHPDALAVVAEQLCSPVTLADWGFAEAKTDQGPGLVGWRHERYHPTADLLPAAIALAEGLEAGGYTTDDITLAAAPPEVWLRAKAARMKEVCQGVLGTAIVHAEPRADVCTNPGDQMLVVFLSQCARTEDARSAAAAGLAPRSGHAAAAASRGPFLVLIVARSFRSGGPGWESDARLLRFEGAWTKALALLDGTPG